jgi:hypothetical protein
MIAAALHDARVGPVLFLQNVGVWCLSEKEMHLLLRPVDGKLSMLSPDAFSWELRGGLDILFISSPFFSWILSFSVTTNDGMDGYDYAAMFGHFTSWDDETSVLSVSWTGVRFGVTKCDFVSGYTSGTHQRRIPWKLILVRAGTCFFATCERANERERWDLD